VVSLPHTQPKALIEVNDLGKVQALLQPDDSLLLRTGWSRHLANPELYRDQLPRVSEGLARWCVERRVKLLGVEPPSVADVTNLTELTRIHRILLGGRVDIVEGLTNLESLHEENVFFMALPLKPAGGDGSPVRALAFEGVPTQTWLNELNKDMT
jgi:kynurenine formamidase